jgi:hypothetical protein
MAPLHGADCTTKIAGKVPEKREAASLSRSLLALTSMPFIRESQGRQSVQTPIFNASAGVFARGAGLATSGSAAAAVHVRQSRLAEARALRGVRGVEAVAASALEASGRGEGPGAARQSFECCALRAPGAVASQTTGVGITRRDDACLGERSAK